MLLPLCRVVAIVPCCCGVLLLWGVSGEVYLCVELSCRVAMVGCVVWLPLRRIAVAWLWWGVGCGCV